MSANYQNHTSNIAEFLKFRLARLNQYLCSIVFFRISLLSIVIFCSILLISVKIKNIAEQLSVYNAINISSTAAESQPSNLSKDEDATKVQEKKLPAEQPVDLLNITPEEYRVLTELSQKKSEVDKTQAPVLKPEKELLATLEKRIDEKTQQLKKVKTDLETLVQSVEEQDQNNIKRIVKMSENMKAPEAAKRLEGIEFDILIEVFEKITEKKAADILSNMDVEKASYLMTTLAKRKRIFKKDGVVEPEKTSNAQ